MIRAATINICRSQRTSNHYSNYRGFSTLILADNDSKTGMAGTTLNVLSAAKKIGKEVSFLATTKEAATEASKLGKTYLAEGCKTADVLSSIISTLSKEKNFTHILGSVSSESRDTLPRVGAHLDVQPISDITDVYDEKTFQRPMYAGNALAKVESSDSVKICTVRPTSFDAADWGSGSFEVENVDVAKSDIAEFISESTKADDKPQLGSAKIVVSVTCDDKPQLGSAKIVVSFTCESDKPQLGSAKIVVSGGRALASSENFDNVLQPLCTKLNAAMGASRAAVDAGYVPNELQVGQTGKVVAPDLYIAVGISGAIQHLAGMKDSKTIVCINKDVDAPIFSVSDYGLVGDLFEVVPELEKKL